MTAYVVTVASGCVAAPKYEQISTKEQYVTSVAGRSINLGNIPTITHLDGTMTGKAGDEQCIITLPNNQGMFNV